MPSAPGTTILQDEGAITLDETGAELVSAGASDCDCCAVTPDCGCYSAGCCFDVANGTYNGHESLDFDAYGVAGSAVAGCVGTFLGTLHVEFDLRMPIGAKVSVDDPCTFSIAQVRFGPGVGPPDVNPAFLFNEVYTWTPAGGSPVDLDFSIDTLSISLVIQANSASEPDGPITWNVALNVSFDKRDALNNEMFQFADSIRWDTVNQGDVEIPGSCGGFSLVDVEYCEPFSSATALAYDHVEIHVTADMSCEVRNNYCCGAEGLGVNDCVSSPVSITGACG